MTDRPRSASAPLRELGKTGLRVSALAWGMWRFAGDDLDAATARVEAALDAGINFFDTADIYGAGGGGGFGAAETLLGRVFARAPSLRAGVVLASKGGIEMGVPYNSSADYLVAACEASLKRLGVERIELYQIHRPDSLAHPAEVAAAFEKLRAAGKIAEAGVSNYLPSQVAALRAHLPFELASIQPEFSALAIEPLSDGVLDHAMQHGMGVMAWSPLGGGRLGGGELGGDRPGDSRVKAVAAALDEIAGNHGVDRAAAAYAWIMAHPSGAIPIVGSQQPERIGQSVEALNLRLSRAEWYAVLTASRERRLP
ncbi:MAG TPA: aldo/keto reductase [Caulobacteraceae bacterium]|jgi:aryl-alcohol dehydrogenase-like predicted oxidoreductase|nr:aldo/keto reductase [Caulobacteraceae bacterium]